MSATAIEQQPAQPMPVQGDLSLLDDPVAQELLVSRIPARLAYVWHDGTPRVIPIAFHWTGTELVVATPPNAPKLHALHDGDPVAVTIDTEPFPHHVLQMRGHARITMVDGVPPEYTAACRRYLGDEMGEGWSAQMGQRFRQLARIAIRPEWVGVIDFQRRLPSALE